MINWLAVGKAVHTDGSTRIAVKQGNEVRFINPPAGAHPGLTSVLHAENPAALAASLFAASTDSVPADAVVWKAPIDDQEVWAAGVTYLRSSEARQRESQGAAVFYDKVYAAPRPELFLKATARRVVGPGDTVRFRADSNWSVPEPEFALVINPAGKIVGLTIGNDMSARDIEGENPLYLPQAKVYRGSCALGPYILLNPKFDNPADLALRITITRQGLEVFQGTTTMDRMKRTPEELVGWLMREQDYPDGAILLTGTGIVPPDEFTLAMSDTIRIELTGLGELTNPVG